MTTVDFITELFCQGDDRLRGLSKHPQACLWPSEGVTLAMLQALNGVGNRAFYRWLVRDYRALFPQLPERTRLCRLFTTHWRWSYAFMAPVTLLSVVDPYGIELLHPIREGRSQAQLGRKGKSNHRWLVGVKRGVLVNRWGLVGGGVWAPANLHDVHFQPLGQAVEGRMGVLADRSFHAATGDPANLKVCRRGEWNEDPGGQFGVAGLFWRHGVQFPLSDGPMPTAGLRILTAQRNSPPVSTSGCLSRRCCRC